MSRIHSRLADDLPINSQVVPAIVDDPYGTIVGEKITVLRSIRNDPLAGMRSRNFIEEHQYLAGRKYQRLIELVQVGAIRAIDPTKEAVSGGRFPEPITDRQIAASDQLLKANAELGQEGAALILDILGHGRTIKEAASRRGASSKREELYIGSRFGECLETLAKLWGLRT